MKAKIEEEERIREENRRIKEWEDKFDREQKIKEEELIKKFYNDQSPIQSTDKNDVIENSENQNSNEENKEN